MSTSRKKNGYRVAPTGAVRGRKREQIGSAVVALPAGRDRAEAGHPLARLFEARSISFIVAEHEAMVESGRPRVPGMPSANAIRWREKRARNGLRPAERAQATRALVPLDAFFRAVAREVRTLGGWQDALAMAGRFGLIAASLLREEDPRGTLEMSAAISTAFWAAQVERDAAMLMATPPGLSASVRTSKTGDAGTVTRATAASYAERHQRAQQSTTCARQERIALADLLLRREKGRRLGLVGNASADSALAERMDAILAADRAAVERGRQMLTEGVGSVDVPAPVTVTVEAKR